jgi:hypothetical protein
VTTPSQLSIVADKARAMYDDEAKERRKRRPADSVPENLPGCSTARDQAGKAVGVSGKLVDAARHVREHGIPGPGAFPPAVGGVPGTISREMQSAG